MRKIILFAAAAMFTVAANAQDENSTQNTSWFTTEDPTVSVTKTRRNFVTAFGSVQGWGKYHSWGFGHFGLEYDRVLRKNWSVGAVGLHAPMNGNGIDDGYAQEEEFTFVGAKVNYYLPVVRGRLWFRFGAGVGVGWHKVTGYDMGLMDPPGMPAPALDTYVKPHLIVDAWGVLRATRWLALRFAPLLLSPSQLIVGGKHNAPYNDSMFRYVNMGAIGATVKF